MRVFSLLALAALVTAKRPYGGDKTLHSDLIKKKVHREQGLAAPKKKSKKAKLSEKTIQTHHMHETDDHEEVELVLYWNDIKKKWDNNKNMILEENEVKGHYLKMCKKFKHKDIDYLKNEDRKEWKRQHKLGDEACTPEFDAWWETIHDEHNWLDQKHYEAHGPLRFAYHVHDEIEPATDE